MYISFTKINPHADGKNGPTSALIHGHIADRVTEHHFKTGKRYLNLTKCGPIPGMEEETHQILAMRRMDFDSDADCLLNAKKLAEHLHWTFKAE